MNNFSEGEKKLYLKMKGSALNMGPYFLTHRCVFSSFSQEQIKDKARLLQEQGIETMIKAHNSNQSTGAMLQLPEYQIAYDLFVPNKHYEQARSILG